MKFNIKFKGKFNIKMYYSSQAVDLENCDKNFIVNPYIKFLKVKTHRYGGFHYIPLPSEESNRKI